MTAEEKRKYAKVRTLCNLRTVERDVAEKSRDSYIAQLKQAQARVAELEGALRYAIEEVRLARSDDDAREAAIEHLHEVLG